MMDGFSEAFPFIGMINVTLLYDAPNTCGINSAAFKLGLVISMRRLNGGRIVISS